jgi:hypothetical protein
MGTVEEHARILSVVRSTACYGPGLERFSNDDLALRTGLLTLA